MICALLRYAKSFLAVALAAAQVFALYPATAAAGMPSEALAPEYGGFEIDPRAAYVSFSLPPTELPADTPGRAEALKRDACTLEITCEYEKRETCRGEFGRRVEYSGDGDTTAVAVMRAVTGSPWMRDLARLRAISRAIKLELIRRSGDEGYREFYEKLVKAPTALFIGPCKYRNPSCANVPLYHFRDGGYDFYPSVVYINDISYDEEYNVLAAINNGMFHVVNAHEIAHGVMFDMYGPRFDDIDSKTNMGHSSLKISDRGMAFYEGWAVAVEALYRPENIVAESESVNSRISEFLYALKNPARLERYLWQPKNNAGEPEDALKNGLQLISSEGIVASQFYGILTSKKIGRAFEKCLTVFYLHAPKDYVEFLRGWVAEFPEDRTPLYRSFLEMTYCATASFEAPQLYRDYLKARGSYIEGKMTAAEFRAAHRSWLAFRENVIEKVLATDELATCVGPDLWFNRPKFPGIKSIKNFHFNLATLGPAQIKKFLEGLTDEDVKKIIRVRDSNAFMNYKAATIMLYDLLGAEKACRVIVENCIANILHHIPAK